MTCTHEEQPSKSVTVIGAANIDINGFSTDPINIADSNPGKIAYSPGGVGRNIAENLYRLGADVKLVSVFGDDPGGKTILSSCQKLGLNTEHSLFLKDAVSSVYLALLDSNGELKVALSDMSILERMTREHIESKAAVLEKSAVIVVDAGLAEDMLRFITERFSGKNIFLDPVSARKAVKAKAVIGRFHTLKLSRMEAECLSGVVIPREDPAVSPAVLAGLEKAGDYFLSKGNVNVYITLGRDGIYFCGTKERFFCPVNYVQPVNTSGGGDAFMAGVVYGSLNGFDSRKTVSLAAAMAAVTVQSKTTVSPDICPELARQTR